ncbi:hypothetical protein EDC01DRAFT_640593 [Geopyxis carbonaria]|nr:hypothetical protein EDC01DRAFT_640593 [Geopyxis carbonaria]
MPPNFPKFTSGPTLIFRGTFVDFPEEGTSRIRSTDVVVDDGEIIHIGGASDAIHLDGIYHLVQNNPLQDVKIIQIPHNCVMMPGFIDCHIHAPQYGQLGTKTDLPLMEWLTNYTFPAESAFHDPKHAYEVYTGLVRRLLQSGTTTALYFGSKHLDATKILAMICNAHGQRALVGKTCMDKMSFGHEDTTEQSLDDTKKFIEWCHERWTPGHNALIMPVITPRFIPTCSWELLQGLGKLAEKYQCRVQTHAVESVDQVALVRDQYPELKRDIAILDDVGLLTNKTILAHCVHLNDEEAEYMACSGASIASCPYSNMLFARGILPVNRFLDIGVNIGLGTDIAGGHSSSMLSAIRLAGLTSRVHGFQSAEEGVLPKGNEDVVDWRTSCWLATKGGATALGLNNVGAFEVGMKWDAIEVNLNSPWLGNESTSLAVDDPEGFFERWVLGHGNERDIQNVWVDGKKVFSRE